MDNITNIKMFLLSFHLVEFSPKSSFVNFKYDLQNFTNLAIEYKSNSNSSSDSEDEQDGLDADLLAKKLVIR